MSATIRARLGTLAGAAIIAVLLWQMGTGAFVEGLRRIDGVTLLAALGLGLLTTVFSAWRWCVVARALRIRLPLVQAVGDYYRSQFLNAALPGGVLGDVHRAVRHGRTEGDVARGVRAVVLERTAGQVVLVMVGVALLFAHPALALSEGGRVLHAVATTPGAAPALLAVCGLGAVAVVRLRRRPGTSRGRRALRAALTEARLGLLARASWPGVVLSSAVVLAGYLGMFLLAARAAGSTAPAVELVPIMVLALLAMALPLNVGGWGPREGVTAWAFGSAGLGAAQGLTVAVVYGVLTFAASLPGLGVLVGQWAVRLRRPQVELEEGVLAEVGPAGPGPERVAHDGGAVEAQPRDAVAEQNRCHGDVQAVQRAVMKKARHRDAATLDQHPAESARRKRLHQALRRERGTVRQGQYVNSVRRRPPVAGVRSHHPQGRR